MMHTPLCTVFMENSSESNMGDLKVVAFIPVRGGSKSIPFKNIKALAGKPLVYYSIEAALASKSITHVVVATDSPEIRNVIRAKFSSAEVELFDRSKESASDNASTEMVMMEYATQHHFDHVILIQATSPGITSDDLDGGIYKYRSESASGLVSVVRQKRFVWEQQGKTAVPANYDFHNRPRRQDFDGLLIENGAFYITSREKLLASGCRISNPVVLWEMHEHTYVELDEEEDWIIMEQLMLKRMDAGVLRDKAKKIKLLLTDVDGVLTDAGMYYGEQGDEFKKFNTLDGKAFELLRKAGIKTGIITSEDTNIVKRRAEKIKSDFIFQGVPDKVLVFEQLLLETGFAAEEVAYIGDDVNDLELLTKVGLSACPSNAVDEVKRVVNMKLEVRGGDGCVRRFASFILENR